MIVAWLVSLTMEPGCRYDGWRWRVLVRYVRKRDGCRCRKCGKRGMLHVHHKRPVSEGGWHWPRNLITLCVGCHEKVHGWDMDGDGRVGYAGR